MMDDGQIILDLQGEERQAMTTAKLMEYYSARSQKELATDRMLFTKE